MLPCIPEGVPSQDTQTLEQSAVDTLLSRCEHRRIPKNGVTSTRSLDCSAVAWTPEIKLPPAPESKLPPAPESQQNCVFGSAKGACVYSQGPSAAFQPISRVPFQAPLGSSSHTATEHSCFCSSLHRYLLSCEFPPRLSSAGTDTGSGVYLALTASASV